MAKRIWLLLVLVAITGCGESEEPSSGPGTGGSGGGDAGGYSDYYGDEEISFLDDASSNASLDTGLASLSFVTSDGEERQVRDIAPEKILVLVVTRGNTQPICLYCSTQTARLISHYESFTERGAEIAVVYPIKTRDDSHRLKSFLADVKKELDHPHNEVPFPVLLDVNLNGVDQLGIRKDLSKPATYIVDREGNVRYAYVGEHIADRPSIAVLLAEVDKLNPAEDSSTE